MAYQERARIGFVSTRLAGTDGVSLETAKWVKILTQLGHECFCFAGESDWPEDHTYIVPEAHFKHPTIQAINSDLFDDYRRSSDTSRAIQTLKDHLKEHLHRFVRTRGLDLLIAENALSLPMNVPLGLALTELITETDIPAIGHHHDFAWERKRYAVSAAGDYLRAAFPPTSHSIHHVVINSFAARQLALRTGASSMLIPNVMDFDTPPPALDAYASQLRPALGLEADEYLILQPTRIVPRKRIERAIELVRRLGVKCTLVISHASGDEGHAYAEYLRDYAGLMGVPTVFAADVISYERGQTPDGRKVFSLADVYQQADLVTYPSTVEGFGNAFLETIYYRRPIVISTYEIFKTDIQPKGFQVIGFEDFITQDTVQQARRALSDPDWTAVMVEHNYELGRRYYSYHVLEKRLVALLSECLGM
ncbi:MAG: glycosyltransferase family 1 protein [Chloroflexi bacterium]|nr:MAG: glycosyltransferase family 1 protein [Chloroflexota bacterium]